MFGYDFKADHDALFDKDDPRAAACKPGESLIISKPTNESNHEGGKRYELGSWQHRLIEAWIEKGAKFDPKDVQAIVRLDITPSEIAFSYGK